MLVLGIYNEYLLCVKFGIEFSDAAETYLPGAVLTVELLVSFVLSAYSLLSFVCVYVCIFEY